jgi:sensor domain CHASE-containing protein
MQFSLYIPVIIIAALLIIFGIVYYLSTKKNVHTELYDEGVKNENDGEYLAALKNYEDALNEITSESKLKAQIHQRIKTIRFTLEYENRFHKGINTTPVVKQHAN